MELDGLSSNDFGITTTVRPIGGVAGVLDAGVMSDAGDTR